MNNRVRHLDLKLSLPAELRAQSWQIAERLRDGFVCEVVERIAERLHAQFGADAIIEIPLLELRWDGCEAIVVDVEYARSLGDEVADDLLSEIGEATVDQAPDGAGNDQVRVRVYRNRIHKAAATVIACARQQQRGATLASLATLEEAWQTLCEHGSAAVAEGAAHLCKTGAVEAVVEALSTTLLEAAIAVYPLNDWPEPLGSAVARRLSDAGMNPLAVNPVQPRRHSAPTAVRQTPQPHTGTATAPDATLPRLPQSERADAHDDRQELPAAASSDEPDVVPGRPAATPDRPGSDRQVQPPASRDRSTDVVAARTGDADVRVAAFETASPPETRADLATTHNAGLIYLLNLALRIELPEILWCCGIDERSFLFDLFRELVAPDAIDPVVTCICGIRVDRSNHKAIAVPDWARAEVLQKVHARLLPRVTGVHYHADDSDIAAMVAAHVPLTTWSTLVTCTAELLVSAFLDLVRAPAAVGIDAYLRLSGELSCDDGQATIALPMEAIDIDVRRAALDVNPGYLAWTQLTCRLVFRPDTELS